MAILFMLLFALVALWYEKRHQDATEVEVEHSTQVRRPETAITAVFDTGPNEAIRQAPDLGVAAAESVVMFRS